jgi:hypothetical protein
VIFGRNWWVLGENHPVFGEKLAENAGKLG